RLGVSARGVSPASEGRQGKRVRLLVPPPHLLAPWGPSPERLCFPTTAGSTRSEVCPLRAQCAVLWHAFLVSGEHAPWGGLDAPDPGRRTPGAWIGAATAGQRSGAPCTINHRQRSNADEAAAVSRPRIRASPPGPQWCGTGPGGATSTSDRWPAAPSNPRAQ